MIDLRSDTVTKPTPEMRRAMFEAELGDDVIEVDPTAEKLQEFAAQLLGKEAAIYMPSGSMTNQIAVRIHCKPGDEFICETGCHIYNNEQAAFAQLCGVVARTVPGNFGVWQLDQLTDLIRPINDHQVRTRMVCIENTHNSGGGKIQPFEEVQRICDWAHVHGLTTHLDGARLMNAVVASGISAAEWSRTFDTVSICLSKGLGAPVGSILAGSREAIREARRHRKLFGGAMRQCGIIAAAGLYGLQHHVERLAEDHAHAQILAQAIRETDGLQLWPDEVDTNIVIFRVDPALGTAAEFVAQLKEQGVLVLSMGKNIRALTHLDVSEAQVRQAASIIAQTAQKLAKQ